MVFSDYSNMHQKLSSPKYASVSDEGTDSEDESILEKQPLSSLYSRRKLVVTLFLTGVAVVIAGVEVRFTFFASHDHSPHEHTSHEENSGRRFRHATPAIYRPHCGRSAEEARSRNCTYDIMLGGWTPPECYSQKLEAEFMTLPELQWFYDGDHTREIPIDVLKEGELEIVHPAWTYHNRHCLYTWRRLHEGIMEGGMVDYQSGSPQHSKHCSQLLMGVIPPKVVKSEEIKYNYCVEPGSVF